MQRSKYPVLALRQFMVQGGDLLGKLGSHPGVLSEFSLDSLHPQGFIGVSDK